MNQKQSRSNLQSFKSSAAIVSHGFIMNFVKNSNAEVGHI